MPIYRVVRDNTDHNRVVYSAGDLIESADDLAAKFPDKFQPKIKDDGNTEVKQDVPAAQKLAVSQPAIKTNINTDEPEAAGLKDVTSDPDWAEVAEKNGITVKHSSLSLAKGGGYFLFDGETEINENGLAKKNVPAAIAAYLK